MKYPMIDINLLPDLDYIDSPLLNANTEDLLILIATYFWESGSINSIMF